MIALVILNLGNATAATPEPIPPGWRGLHRRPWNALLDDAAAAKFAARFMFFSGN